MPFYGDLTPGAIRALRLFRLYCKGIQIGRDIAWLWRRLAVASRESSKVPVSQKISAHSKVRDSADAVTYRLDQGSPPDKIDRGHCILDSPRCVATGDREDPNL
jgi:hypothetical protein